MTDIDAATRDTATSAVDRADYRDAKTALTELRCAVEPISGAIGLIEAVPPPGVGQDVKSSVSRRNHS